MESENLVKLVANLVELVEESQAMAGMHAKHCKECIGRDQLAEAIDYCRSQGIDPPQCSLTAKSPNADKMRAIAQGMLSDETWWKKRLRIKAEREFEHEQIKKGNVTNYISDATVEYMKKR